MRKLSCLLFIFAACISLLSAQVGVDVFHYHFSKIQPLTMAEEERYKEDGAVFLDKTFIYDYMFDQEGNFVQIFCSHLTAKIFSENKLELFNTVSDLDMKSLIDLQTRIIHADGSTDLFTAKDIIAVPDTSSKEKDDSTYNIYFKTLKAGDVIECFLIRQINAGTSKTLFVGDDDDYLPILHANYTFIMPAHLKPDVKVYNREVAIIDTLLDRHGEEDAEAEDNPTRYTYVEFSSPVILRDESNATPLRYSPRIEFTIAYNLSSGSSNRITSAAAYVRDIYTYMNELDKNDLKAAKAIAKEIILPKEASDRDKIAIIENYIKAHYHCYNFSGGAFDKIAVIQQYHIGNELGFIKLYNQLLNIFKIDHQIVSTTNIEDKEFDKKFEGSNFFQEFLFYFPTLDQYVCPSNDYFRLGLTPRYFLGNDAAFLKLVSMGKATTYTPIFKKIKALPYTASFDSLYVQITPDIPNKQITGTETRLMGGYLANTIQRNMKDFEIEQEEYFLQHYLGFGNENVSISGEKYIHNNPEDIGLHPLTLKARFTVPDYIVCNTNRIELTAGAFIGEQSKIEEKRTRLCPVDIAYGHDFYRVITVTIPEGYALADAYHDLNRTVYDHGDAQTAGAGFVVTTEVKNNQLIIYCHEFYKQTHYSVEEYPAVKLVWDAASDFNAAKIYLDKK